MADLVGGPIVMIGAPRPDYALVDSGGGRKLERYGDYRFIRPEPQAMWTPAAPEWQADGEFIPGADADGGGRWQLAPHVPQDGWELGWEQLRFTARNTPFRHLAYFPDMDPVWRWLRDQVPVGAADTPVPTGLNLFGYTGVGTLALAAHGIEMTHVDASKRSVAQARDNAALSGLADRPIRWLVDDAAKFTAREVRRGRRYDAILLDPPKFGRGPTGETWRIETDLAPLIADCRRLLDARSRALFLTVYAVRMSALALGALLDQAFAGLPGRIECGELAVREEASGRALPSAIFARWSNPA